MDKETKVNQDAAIKIVEHLCNEKPKAIRELVSGMDNSTYEVTMKSGDDLIVKIANFDEKINSYLKEQWCTRAAIKNGVPSIDILEVGNEIVPYPYMVSLKVNALEAIHHPERIKILEQMGKYNAIINTIKTEGYGDVFDWSSNILSKNATWQEFMEKEWQVDSRLETFTKFNIFEPEKLDTLIKNVEEMKEWDIPSTLTHGDMRLKNVLINEDGKIQVVFDWEFSTSNVAPYWDLSIALHDLSVDEKDAFLSGYGMKEDEYRRVIKGIKTINLLNYSWAVGFWNEKKNEEALDKLKTRLNGGLDLYSL